MTAVEILAIGVAAWMVCVGISTVVSALFNEKPPFSSIGDRVERILSAPIYIGVDERAHPPQTREESASESEEDETQINTHTFQEKRKK